MIKLVRDLRQVVFSGYSDKIDRHDITEILLKVVFKHGQTKPSHVAHSELKLSTMDETHT